MPITLDAKLLAKSLSWDLMSKLHTKLYWESFGEDEIKCDNWDALLALMEKECENRHGKRLKIPSFGP